MFFFFFSSRRRHTRFKCDWSSDVCSSDLVFTKTDARAITTTFNYDVLDRLTQKSFSDATPTVKYGYDGVAPPGCTPPSLTATNGIGRRTAMCDAAGAEAWSFDSMGRPLVDQRT